MPTAIVLFKVDPKKVTGTAEKLLDIPAVTDVYSISGRYDLLAIINTKRRTLYAEHPEAFYVTAIVTACPDDLATVGLTLDVAPEYVEALREYVVKTVQTEDGDDSANLQLVKIHDQNAEGLVE